MRRKILVRNFTKSIVTLSLVFCLLAEPALANYRAASGFFARRDYISSAAAYFQAYSYPKAAGEKEKAEWGLAQSLQKLGFYYSASKYYSLIVRRGPTWKDTLPRFETRRSSTVIPRHGRTRNGVDSILYPRIPPPLR